jgi:hypothetical protein
MARSIVSRAIVAQMKKKNITRVVGDNTEIFKLRSIIANDVSP